MAALALVSPVARGAEAAVKPNANIELARQLNSAFVQVAEEVSPCVVVITVLQRADAALQGLDSQDEIPPELRQFLRRGFTTGQGSGVIVREDGFILTNGHVVENAQRIDVRLKDGRTFRGTVRGVDVPSDVAVIKIEAKNLPVAKLADSAKTRVGEFAIAIGAPFALDYSVTFGHVSAKDRANVMDDPENPTLLDQSFIQTDANINPGNSGGPLVNIDGEVIGINTLIRGLRTGIGFAIPSNLAREISDKIITEGKYTRSWLGITIRGLREDPSYREMVSGVKDGVVVEEILADGPAAKSNLKPGDVITAVDGATVAAAQELKDDIRSKTPGSDVKLSVFRPVRNNGFQTNILVKPGEWKPAQPTPAQVVLKPNGTIGSTNAGLHVEPLHAPTRGLQGVYVAKVDTDSLADHADIAPGDIITSVGDLKVTSPSQLAEILKTADCGRQVIEDEQRLRPRSAHRCRLHYRTTELIRSGLAAFFFLERCFGGRLDHFL